MCLGVKNQERRNRRETESDDQTPAQQVPAHPRHVAWVRRLTTTCCAYRKLGTYWRGVALVDWSSLSVASCLRLDLFQLELSAGTGVAYRVGARSTTINANESGSTGPRPRPDGGGANFAETRNTRWFVGSSPMLRANGAVFTFSTTWYWSAESWCTTVSVPSAFEAKTSCVAGSNPHPSTPMPIGAVAIVLPAW